MAMTTVSLVGHQWHTSLVKAIKLPVDYAALAQGVFELFNEDEVLMLQLTGMLPSEKILCFRTRLSEMLTRRWDLNAGKQGEEAVLSAMVTQETGIDFVEFRLRDLVREIVHEVTLAIYRHARLLV